MSKKKVTPPDTVTTPETAARLASQSQDDLIEQGMVDPADPVVDHETAKAIAGEDPIFAYLHNRITALEALIVRMAHNSGTSHSIIKQAGLTPYNPTKADMSKFDRVAVTGR